MSRKSNLTSIRIGVFQTWSSYWYDEGFSYTSMLYKDLYIKDFVNNIYYKLKLPSTEVSVKTIDTNTLLVTNNCYMTKKLFKYKIFNKQYALYITNIIKLLVSLLKVINKKKRFTDKKKISLNYYNRYKSFFFFLYNYKHKKILKNSAIFKRLFRLWKKKLFNNILYKKTKNIPLFITERNSNEKKNEINKINSFKLALLRAFKKKQLIYNKNNKPVKLVNNLKNSLKINNKKLYNSLHKYNLNKKKTINIFNLWLHNKISTLNVLLYSYICIYNNLFTQYKNDVNIKYINNEINEFLLLRNSIKTIQIKKYKLLENTNNLALLINNKKLWSKFVYERVRTYYRNIENTIIQITFNNFIYKIEQSLKLFLNKEIIFISNIHLQEFPAFTSAKLLSDFIRVNLEKEKKLASVFRELVFKQEQEKVQKIIELVKYRNIFNNIAERTKKLGSGYTDKRTKFLYKLALTYKQLYYKQYPLIGIRIECNGNIKKGTRTKLTAYQQWIRDFSLPGKMPNNSYNADIHYYQSVAYTKRAAIGIKVWLMFETPVYDNNFKKINIK